VSTLECDSSPTSNDLLRRLVANQPLSDRHYQVVAQSADDVQNIENAPAVSIVPYLLASGQITLLTKISVYSLRGESREQVRLLYMNAVAIRVWDEMAKMPKIIGAQFRPHALPCSRSVSPSANSKCDGRAGRCAFASLPTGGSLLESLSIIFVHNRARR